MLERLLRSLLVCWLVWLCCGGSGRSFDLGLWVSVGRLKEGGGYGGSTIVLQAGGACHAFYSPESECRFIWTKGEVALTVTTCMPQQQPSVMFVEAVFCTHRPLGYKISSMYLATTRPREAC